MSAAYKMVRDYLIDLEFTIISTDEAEELFVVEKPDSGISNLIIDCEETILIIEGVLFELKKDSMETFKSLLIQNRQIVHGAFALNEEGTMVLFRDTLQLENLDLNELEGTLNSLELLLSEYGSEILKFAKQ